MYTSSSPLPSPPSFGHPEPACKRTLSSKWWSRLRVRKQDSSHPLPLSYLSMKGLLVLETGHILSTLFHMLEHFPLFLHTLWAETMQGEASYRLIQNSYMRRKQGLLPPEWEFILKGTFSVLYQKCISLLFCCYWFFCCVFSMNTFITTPPHWLVDCF